MIQKTKDFFRESKQELKRVNWPSREDTVRYTVFVIAFSVVFAGYLGLLDFGFLKGLQAFILTR